MKSSGTMSAPAALSSITFVRAEIVYRIHLLSQGRRTSLPKQSDEDSRRDGEGGNRRKPRPEKRPFL